MMTRIWNRLRAALRGHVSHWIAAGAVVVALLAFLWGPGLLTQPELVLSTAAVDLKIPTKIKMEMFWLRMLLEKPEVATLIEHSMAESLVVSGMPDDRVEKIVSSQGEGIELAPHEENAVNAAIAKATTQMQNKLLESLAVPEAVLFLELRNTGRAAAKEVQVTVRLLGRPYDIQIDTDNRLTSKEAVGSEYRLNFDRIAPGSLTKCTIWYSRQAAEKSEMNEVVVVYDRGTIRQGAAEGSVALGSE